MRSKSTGPKDLRILTTDPPPPDVEALLAAHEVDELLVVDPQERSVNWFALESGRYVAIEHSQIINMSRAELAKRIDWPPVSALDR